MVSDAELARRIESFERSPWGDTGPELADRVERLEESARGVHDELARRIEETQAGAATRDDLSDVVERLEDIESRLDDLESRL